MSQFTDDFAAFYDQARKRVRRVGWALNRVQGQFLNNEGKPLWERSFVTDDIDIAIQDLRACKLEIEAAEKQAKLAREEWLQERADASRKQKL